MPTFSELLVSLWRMDKLALLVMVFLLCAGTVVIYDAGMDYGGRIPNRWMVQVAWILIGMVLYVSCALTDYRVLGRYSWSLYCVGLVLLLLVFVSGGKDNSARSVLNIAGLGIQVSEPMKAATLIFGAYLLSNRALRTSAIPPVLLWLGVVILPFGLILLHGDGGTALVFLPFTFAILFVNGLKWRWIALIAVLVLVTVPIAYHCLKPYQKLRILVFMQTPCRAAINGSGFCLSPESRQGLHQKLEHFIESQTHRDQEGGRFKGKKILWDDWNARQAFITVGAGGLRGLGFLNGKQHTLGYLPRRVASTDFIFAVLAEEWGFIGTLVVMSAQILLIVLYILTALRANDCLGASIALGGAVIIGTHVAINVGMCIGMAPIIGIPLPFVSYGGSSILGMLLTAGLVQSVSVHTKRSTQDELNQEPAPADEVEG